ncbi:MAG: DnaB-like helicase C-terminal domain-containing protein [Alphaproteobacteria bacterium]|nr:DnaB-like helicase C-terminal domain-containing protein [Alphaproteobacteria bacterium]
MTTHLSTGFKALDVFAGGLNGGELVLIGGRPGMGITSFALNLAVHIAQQEKNVLYFNFNDKAEYLDCRFLTVFARNKIKKTLPIHFYRGFYPPLESIRKTIGDFSDGIAAIIIDYLQVIEGEKRSLMLQRLKEIAKDFDAPVIVLTHLTRAPENRKNKRPRLNDIRDYKDLSAADKVLFLYRESYYLKHDMPEQRTNETEEAYLDRFREWNLRISSIEKNCELIIAKNPSGPCGTVNLFFEGLTGFFWE